MVGEIGSKSLEFSQEPGKRRVLWLQGITLVWLLVELVVSAYAAVRAHSPALLAFGSDSLVELFSASAVLLQLKLSRRLSDGLAAGLLLLLAVVVTASAIVCLVIGREPAESVPGVLIAAAALVVMPVLAWLKRKEARRSGNATLAADAVQSAACAYLALLALVGLGVNAMWHVGWMDTVAALVMVPFLLLEARETWAGRSCSCCSNA